MFIEPCFINLYNLHFNFQVLQFTVLAYACTICSSWFSEYIYFIISLPAIRRQMKKIKVSVSKFKYSRSPSFQLKDSKALSLPSLPTICGTIIVNQIVKHFASRGSVQWLPSLTATHTGLSVLVYDLSSPHCLLTFQIFILQVLFSFNFAKHAHCSGMQGFNFRKQLFPCIIQYSGDLMCSDMGACNFFAIHFRTRNFSDFISESIVACTVANHAAS